MNLDLQRIAILLVEDNPFMRRLLRSVLGSLGCREIRDAPDGAAALKVITSGYAPDLILTNWQMPNMDGIEFVRRVRTDKDSANPYLPIIMVSSHSEKSRITEARDAGVTEFLVKPISAKLLYQRIVAIVQHPRPFVKTGGFFGPERRRKTGGAQPGPERRGAATSKEKPAAPAEPGTTPTASA